MEINNGSNKINKRINKFTLGDNKATILKS